MPVASVPVVADGMSAGLPGCRCSQAVVSCTRLDKFVRLLRSQAWCVLEVVRSEWDLVQEFPGHPLWLYAVVYDAMVRPGEAKKMEAVRSHHNASSQIDPC